MMNNLQAGSFLPYQRQQFTDIAKYRSLCSTVKTNFCLRYVGLTLSALDPRHKMIYRYIKPRKYSRTS